MFTNKQIEDAFREMGIGTEEERRRYLQPVSEADPTQKVEDLILITIQSTTAPISKGE